MGIIIQLMGYGTVSMEFKEDEPLQDLLMRLAEQESISFATADRLPDGITVQKALDAGRAMTMDEIILDEQVYVVNSSVQKVG